MSKSTYRWLIGLCIVVAVLIATVVALLAIKRPTIVPDVTMKTVAEANQLIESAGLKVGGSSQTATGSVGPGFVAQQFPAPASTVPRRSSVDITVSVTPTSADVPLVIGLAATQAVKKLTDTLYIPMSVDVFGPAAQGVVLDQIPSAGTSWMTGRPVAIGVAAGPDDGTGTTVPNLKGDSLDISQAKLAKANLASAGFLTQINDPQANVVVDQLPEGGVVVRPGTTVLLLLRTP